MYIYTPAVLQALKNDPDTQNFDFSQVDQRGANPNFPGDTPDFRYDNSITGPDNVIDYTIIVWRNTKQPFGLMTEVSNGNGGWASPGYLNNIPSLNGQTYRISPGAGYTQTYGMSGVLHDVFQHEFAHTLYNSPHYFFANSVIGEHFYGTQGPGMMAYYKTHDAANAWERWYNGWIELQTGANHVNSDIQFANQLVPTNGEYTLRDYVSTGDVMRIRIPGSTSQYLWLENHQHVSNFDNRAGWATNSQIPSLPFPSAPTGIMALIEDMETSRAQPFLGGIVNDITGCNGLKVLSAQGNFDYTHSATSSTYNNYQYNHPIFDFTNPIANPFGGENQITDRRLDGENTNGALIPDNIIYNGRTGGNSGGPHDEHYYSLRLNGTWENGMFGPNVEFNTPGQKMGIAHNPAITEHQRYDQNNSKLLPLHLNGLSVELLSKDASGSITVKVRYDDVEVARNTRWSGDLLMTNVLGTASGADVHVTGGATLTIDKSGTNNRHSKTAANEFINPTSFVCGGASIQFLQDGGSTVNVEGAKTAFQVKDGGELKMNSSGTTFVVKAGAVLDLQNGGVFTSVAATTLRVEAGGTLVVRNGAKLQGNAGTIQIQDNAYLCVENGADLTNAAGIIFKVAPNAIIGTNPALNLSTLNCSSQLQFCGRLIGGNTNLSASCPTRNEALLFDGQNDRVTIPQDPNGSASPIHNLGQTFTIEALVSSALVGQSQPIFSTRLRDAYGFHGLMFSIFNGNHLLLQINEQNYYDYSDPTMTLGSGCHHVAVTRDGADQLHFYIDGQRANYSPTYIGDPHTNGDAFIGGDLGYFSDESFHGQIGEVRVWNITRSDVEISQHQSASLMTPQTGLVGYYDMSDPSAQSVGDISDIYYSSSYAPNGYLGTTTSTDTNDPSWINAANLTCTVNGHFRPTPGPSLLDTVGRAHRQMSLTGTTTTKHLSQVTLSPNPATGEAVMHFQLREAGRVNITIQDMIGETRATALPSTRLEAGAHDVKLPLHSIQPGLYLVIVNSADGRTVIRLEVK